MKQSELHLIILWENARRKEKEILNDLQKNLIIRQIYEVKWTPSLVSDNFSRFYGVKLPKNSGKERDVGTGPFLLVIVEDDNPKYEFMETGRGHEYVNKNIFSLKLKYRLWVGGSRVHTTNTPKEMNHDATLLLGYNYEDLKKSLPARWDGRIQKLNRDITGAKGWKSLSELFYTLNATIDYLVLRGFEDFQKTLCEHTDIDIMIRESKNAELIIGGIVCYQNHTRHKNLINVGQQKIYIDLWDINNNYHDRNWDEDIIRNRVFENGVWIPSKMNYFYMLIYHSLIHKQNVAQDYYEKVYTLFLELGLDKKYDISLYDNPFDLYFQLLEKFMKDQHYSFTLPHDNSLFYSEKLVQIDQVRSFLQENYGFKNLIPVQVQLIGQSNQLFLKGQFGKETAFVKVGCHKEIYKNEYQMTKQLYDLDPDYFVKPLLWRENDDLSFVAMNYVRGIPLDKFMESCPSAMIKKKMILDLFQIFLDMKLSQIIHRDIRPANFIVVDHRLKLIDFQLAVAKGNYKELDYLLKNNLWRVLGEKYAVESGTWDDAYSLLKVLEFIGSDPSYQTDYQKIYSEISEYIGYDRITYEQGISYSLFKLIKYKLKSCFSWTHAKCKNILKNAKKIRKIFDFL